ncbi:MAG TPA: DUF1801 domain-containing protein [Rhizomicrobium sp.]|nr:DUF1801 domain-containing protein [Rhizomicrobium sp.]
MPAATVDAYIKAVPEAARPMLKELRALVQKAAPKAEEYISYGMPYYRYHGALLGFAAFKQHVGFFPGAIVTDFADELKGYKTSRGTVQLPYGKKIPVSLIRRIIKAGVKRNEDVAKAKKKTKQKKVRKS